MKNHLHTVLLAGLLYATAHGLGMAEEGQPAPDDTEVSELVSEAENTSFVWLKHPIGDFEIQSFATKFAEGRVGLTFPTIGGFVVRMKHTEAETRAFELNSGDNPMIDYVEPGGAVFGFDADCGADMGFPTTQRTDPGVQRVNGPIPGPFTGRVWIIDSGVASDYDSGPNKELNVDRTKSLECDASTGCSSGPANKDKIGHGTISAGIIAAINDADGFVGIAPGATVIPVQIFKKRRAVVKLEVVYSALALLLNPDPSIGAQSGDVINISWGADWDPRPGENPRKIEGLLRQLADRGVKIAVAAGNNDSLQGSGYVLTITPARAGAYRHLSSAGVVDGAIVTVSAVESVFDSVTMLWTDTFWEDSAFGNGELNPATGFHLGPPDFAEPGVNIESLWPGVRRATCTGTSFAAAHMSGILLKAMPNIGGMALGDPDSSMFGASNPQLNDPIGIH